MKLTKLEEEFSAVARLSGGVFLLQTKDALRFVKELNIVGIPVLGIDGFRVLGSGRIQPQQDHSIDFQGEVKDSHQQALGFLEERLGLELWFEVVSAEPRS